MKARGGQHKLSEHKRAEIAGRCFLKEQNPVTNVELADEYGVCPSTIGNVKKDFLEPHMMRKAIAAAEQYYLSNPRPAQPGASTTPVGSQASIPNLHSKFGFAF